MKISILKDDKFIKSLVTIAIPIAIQNFFSTALNFVDSIMIGGLGDTAITAVGQANKLFFFCALILFGVYSGFGVFVAQFWGQRDIKNIKKVLGLSLIVGGSVSILFSVVALLNPMMVMKIFSDDPKVISLGVDYLRIIGISYFAMSISFAFGMASRCVGQTKIPMYASVASLILNTGLNYILIFGFMGIPALGVKGAAIATLISRSVELLLMLYLVYIKNGGIVIASKICELLDFSKAFVKNIFSTALPVIINEFFWSLGMIVYAFAYGKISTGAVAAVEISNNVLNIFMIIGRSIANASAVMIGNRIGDNNLEEAYDYASALCKLGSLIGLVMGAVMAGTSVYFVKLFAVSDTIRSNAISILLVFGAVAFVKILNGILVVGVFRSGGDTMFSMLLECGSVWLVGVPVALIGTLVLKLPVVVVVALIQLEEVVKVFVGIHRLKSKKWIKNVVNEME